MTSKSYYIQRREFLHSSMRVVGAACKLAMRLQFQPVLHSSVIIVINVIIFLQFVGRWCFHLHCTEHCLHCRWNFRTLFHQIHTSAAVLYESRLCFQLLCAGDVAIAHARPYKGICWVSIAQVVWAEPSAEPAVQPACDKYDRSSPPGLARGVFISFVMRQPLSQPAA